MGTSPHSRQRSASSRARRIIRSSRPLAPELIGRSYLMGRRKDSVLGTERSEAFQRITRDALGRLENGAHTSTLLNSDNGHTNLKPHSRKIRCSTHSDTQEQCNHLLAIVQCHRKEVADRLAAAFSAI